VLVAQPPQRAQEFGLHHAHAALAHDRLDQDRRGFRPDGALGRREVAERHLVEALDHGTEAVEIFFLPAGREGGERASMERAFEGDDAVAFRPAAR